MLILSDMTYELKKLAQMRLFGVGAFSSVGRATDF